MAALNNSKIQYVGSVQWAAVPDYPGAGSVAAGTLCTNAANSPAVGSERVFVCVVGGVTAGTAPTFTNTKGALTEDAATTIYWQECTGQPGVNGDITNCPVWGSNLTVILGQIIYDSNTLSLQIAGSSFTTHNGAAPTFSATAGTTSTGQDVGKWTSLGLASAFGAWAAPHARVLNADAATWQTVVPATIFIADNHAETAAAAITLAGGQGVAATPNNYLSVSYAVAPPVGGDVTAGATIATTGANNITIENYGYYYGITFLAGSTTNTGDVLIRPSFLSFENCVFQLNNTSVSSIISIELGILTLGGNFCLINNCAHVFGSTSQKISLGAAGSGGRYVIENSSFAATGSAPSVLFSGAATENDLIVRASNMANITGTLFSAGSGGGGFYRFENCEIGSGVAMTSGTFFDAACQKFIMHNCDSTNTNYRFYEKEYLATIQSETTTVDSTNPATDGTTNVSWKITTSAYTSFGQPYITEYLPIIEWNGITGTSITATVHLASNTTLTNANIWLEVEYLGGSSYPIASIVTNRVTDILTVGTALTTSTDSWGGSQSTFQKLAVSFTPNMAGPIKARLFIAIPTTTLYVNPRLLLGTAASGRQYLMPGMGYVNEGAAGGGLFRGGAMSGGCNG